MCNPNFLEPGKDEWWASPRCIRWGSPRWRTRCPRWAAPAVVTAPSSGSPVSKAPVTAKGYYWLFGLVEKLINQTVPAFCITPHSPFLTAHGLFPQLFPVCRPKIFFADPRWPARSRQQPVSSLHWPPPASSHLWWASKDWSRFDNQFFQVRGNHGSEAGRPRFHPVVSADLCFKRGPTARPLQSQQPDWPRSRNPCSLALLWPAWDNCLVLQALQVGERATERQPGGQEGGGEAEGEGLGVAAAQPEARGEAGAAWQVAEGEGGHLPRAALTDHLGKATISTRVKRACW